MTEDEDYDALSQKHLASIKRDTRVSLEDAMVRAMHKVMAEFEREALAESEVFSKQNYLNGYCVGQSDLLAEQAKQEPAAWMVYTQDGKSVYITDNPTDIESNQRALPLYVTPKREWVGLTVEQIEDVGFNLLPTVAQKDFVAFARYVEAKLKEKNQ